MPVGCIVETAPDVRTEGDLTIVPVVEEVLVVEKRLVLKEELHIRRTSQTEVVEVPVTLRKQRAVVERQVPHTSPSEGDPNELWPEYKLDCPHDGDGVLRQPHRRGGGEPATCRGNARDSIRLVPGHERDEAEGAAAPSLGEASVSFWDSLRDLFLPDEDRDTYAEGLRRGGYLVSVTRRKLSTAGARHPGR